MENTQAHVELRSNTRSSTKFDDEDKILQCNAYLGTKLFMAKRIADQQKEIEILKDQLYYHTTRHTELYDVLKNLNEQLAALQRKAVKHSENLHEQDKNEINFSGDLANSFTLEGDEEDNKENKEKLIKEKFNLEHDKDKIIESLKNENLSLRKELEVFKTENLEKIFFCDKLVYEKYIVLTELNELVNCLKQVDLEMLNKFYNSQRKENNFSEKTQNLFDLSKSNYISSDYFKTISSMGIKYNILSAQSQITLLMKSFHKEGEFIINSNEKEKKIEVSSKHIFHLDENTNQSKDSILANFEKCCGLLRSYEEDLNSYVYDMNNANRPLGFPKKRSDSY
jgi:hypothetical protein